MFVTDLESRRNKILDLIIDSYINTGIPISSRIICHKFRLGLSPATIRNVMADLEEMGFITHPYTSAGRMPTEKGYRFYVDTLMQARQLTMNEKNRIQSEFETLNKELEEIVSKASKILSLVSSQAGMVLFPRLRESAFWHIELVSIEPKKVLVVLMTKGGITKNLLLDFLGEITPEELNKIARFLNGEFGNVSLSQIKHEISKRLLQERDSFFYILEQTGVIIDQLIKNIDVAKLHFEGAFHLLEQPEFSNTHKAKCILRVLEDRDFILNILQGDLEQTGIKIRIGTENGCEELKDCALVTSNYKIKDNICGILGIIGPTRMEYSRMVSLVDYMSDVLTRLLS